MSRDPIPTHTFVMVVARLGHRFLVIRERKHGSLWYLPAGRVEPGEAIVAAARRETREEAGIDAEPNGILRIDHTPLAGYTRQRFWLVASPVGDARPRPTADSLDAGWFSLEEIAGLDLRGREVIEACRHVANGGAIHPLHLLRPEGSPWLSH